MAPMRSALLPWSAAVVLLALACSGGPPKNVEPRFAEVAAIHRARCGGCHRRVEPGERSRAKLTVVLPRHHDRVKNLTDAQWALMLDYLSADTKSAP
jgi:hypothetical protein